MSHPFARPKRRAGSRTVIPTQVICVFYDRQNCTDGLVDAAVYELAINLKAANTLGLTISVSILARADEVIE
jgi:ABC-type uncharacterized transport system substrate-binding protein